MTKNSDIDSIIKMLRSDAGPTRLKGGQMSGDVALEANGTSDDRTTMVIVLGIIAGLVLGALFYYCVMYMPASAVVENTQATACESSLKKEDAPSSKSKKSVRNQSDDAPKRVTNDPVALARLSDKKKAVAKTPKDESAKKNKASSRQSAAPTNHAAAPIRMLEQPLFSVAQDTAASGMSLSSFASEKITESEFKMPSKPLQPSLNAAKDVAGNSSASKLLDANKQLIEATENNRLRQKMMIASDGLAQYKPEVPVARRRGEEANMPLLEKMRSVNGDKIRKITKSKDGPGLFETPMSIYEAPEPSAPVAGSTAIGKQLKTDHKAVGLTMNAVLDGSLPY